MKRFLFFFFAFAAIFSVLGWVAPLSLAADKAPISLNDLAGEYYFGDGTGVNCTLTLTGQATFAFIWRGCLGTYDENNGGVRLKEGVVHLAPEKPNVRKGIRGTPTKFVSVRWVSRIYLVPTEEMVEFCSAVNQGIEPRSQSWGEFYLRQNDWSRPVTGLPTVPEPWRRYFLAKPVSGKITELIGKQEAWFDRGSAQGLLKGMILTAKDSHKPGFAQVKIEEVEKNRCRVKCEYKGDRLKVGQTVSSRFYD